MNSMKKNCLVFGLLILVLATFTTVASAQYFYPPVPYYGYNTLPPGFGYFPPAPVPQFTPNTGYGVPYRGANALLNTLLLLGLLPTTTTTTPTLTSLFYPTTTLPTTTLLPTTTSTIGLTTTLLLGGVNTTTLLLLGL